MNIVGRSMATKNRNLPKIRKLKNQLKVREDYIELVLSSSIKVLIDKDDYTKVTKFKWYYSSNGYIMSDTRLYLHRYILNAPKGLEVDHINHNKFDNRKCNLRLCTRSQNSRNKKYQSNSKTQVKGVYLCKTTGKYACELHIEGKRIWLGRYSSLEEARLIRKQAEIKYFGEYNYMI